MKNVNTDNSAAGPLWGFLFLLFAVGMFLVALVLFGIMVLIGGIFLGVFMLIGMVLLWFGPSAWKPFIMMGMILILALVVVLLMLK